MSYPKKLLRLQPRQGIIVDVPPHEVGPNFYTSGQNVIFRRGFANRVKGSRDAYTTAIATANPIQIFHLLNAVIGTSNFWIVIEADGTTWAIEGSNATQIDNLLLSSVTQPSVYSSALLNGLPIISNGLDELVFWAGTGNLALLPGWTATESAKFIAVFRFHIFAMDISGPGGNFPNLVKWSDAAAPGTVPSSWTPSASTTAGSVELADGKGPVLCALSLKDTLIFYKQSMSYGAQFVSGNQIFAFQPLNRSAGALNRHSVVDIGERHLIVEQGDITISDGINRQSIGESRQKDFLFNQLDQDNFENLFTVFFQPTSEVLIAFPSVGSQFANIGLMYNVERDSFGIVDLPNIEHAATGFVTDTTEAQNWNTDSEVWDDDSSAWNSTSIFAANESLVFARLNDIELQNTNDPVIKPAFIGKHDLTFGEPERVKFVKRVHVRAENGYGTLLVRIGSRMTTTEEITWTPEVMLVEPEQIVNLITQGRYISIELRSNSDNAWVINAIELEAELRGYH